MSRKYRPYALPQLLQLPEIQSLGKSWLQEMEAASHVFPTRVSSYILEELIDWENPLSDSLFKLFVPQPEMLTSVQKESMLKVIHSGLQTKIKETATEIRNGLNPHPSNQLENIPHLQDGRILQGLQHKYLETVLFFPQEGQTCHSYCTFCFRFPQFVDAGPEVHKFSMKEIQRVIQYLQEHEEVTDLLITGGDPMIMTAAVLDRYITPLLESNLPHLKTIRIGTKSLTNWPYRFISDRDSEELLKLLGKVKKSGKNLAIMAHFNHPRELETSTVKVAIQRLQEIGAVIRSQSPVLRHINDSSEIWSSLWKEQVQLGIVPYYMFVERDTGAHHYFSLPLIQTWKIFSEAIRSVSGIARSVRGPCMSSSYGKIEVLGPAQYGEHSTLALRMIQGRDPSWGYRPFFAEFNEEATWIDDLTPAFGEEKFFFQK